jgi:poly-gamma-glutamate capsule biosynthesis protein CapA/YwtB (metallophosphatase superfamily)
MLPTKNSGFKSLFWLKRMKKTMKFLHFASITWLLMSFTVHVVNGQYSSKPGSPKQIIIENFDLGTVDFTSYPGEDEDPLDWEINSAITYENSPWSLKLSGNTWKVQGISPVVVNAGDVWQVSAYIASKAEIQGFAIMDSANVLFYSFAGSEMVNIEEWVPVYQGCFPEDQWNDYQLPVADDWLAFFDYLPEITALVYINDKDGTSQGEVYFDNIINISSDLPYIPEVSIDFTVGGIYTKGNGSKVADVQFYGQVIDPDSEEHDFFWNFGDDSTSTEQNPQHTFIVTDDHPYRVILRVVDSTNRWGQASCSVEIDPGNSSYPITLNFAGDIMLARRYENPGGIIPTLGVETIFAPTKPFLGDAADITIANLECPLTTYWEHHPTKSIYFKGSPANIAGLTYAGINIVSLANNHILDYMLQGMQETKSVLEENDILYMGAGANSYEAYMPAFYSKSGVNFAFLAASDRTGQYNNEQPYLNAGYNKPGFANLEPWYIKKQIDEVKDVSDLVVLEWHTGIEYTSGPGDQCDTCFLFGEDNTSDENYFPLAYAPDPKDRTTTHFAIDNGADLVICHHPHMVQGVELYNGKLIAHSLGNFAFDQEFPETYPSFILNTKVNETGFYEFTLTPVYIDDYIPQRAEGGLGLHILDDLAQRSKNLDTYLQIDRDSVTATVIMDTSTMVTSFTEYFVILPLEEAGSTWTTPPHPLTRSGSISSVNSIEPTGIYEFRLGRDLIFFGTMEDEGCTLWNLNSDNENYCDTSSFSGERSIQHIRTSNSSSNIITNFEERIICPSNTVKFSLCSYIKTKNGADVTIEIRYHSDRTGIVPLNTENIGVQIFGDTPWTFYHRELTIPAGTKFFDIRMSSGIPNAGTAYAWFDNISLIRWDDWTAYEISQAIPTPNDYYFIQVKSPEYSDAITLNYSEAVYGPAHNILVDLKVFLEGPFNGTDMDTDLAGMDDFPLNQPYNENPWNYQSNESATTIPADVVDWVLVELRDATDAATATAATRIARQAAFLMSDGNIRFLDGTSIQQFENLTIQHSLFAVIYHRNHLASMSANPIIESAGIYTYDFTNGEGQAYNNGQKEIALGIWGMFAGDADASGLIEEADKTSVWDLLTGKSGYWNSDLNMDSQSNNKDKNDYWLPNLGEEGQVPE